MDDIGAYQFPIGYTIDFSPPPSPRRGRGGRHLRLSTSDYGSEDNGPGEDAPRGGSGSQVLPVAEALASELEGEPTNGAEYLLLVRRQARALPKVARRPETAEKPHINGTSAVPATGERAGSPHRPLESWRQAFLPRFRAMRQSIVHLQSAPSRTLPPIPAPRDESHWKVFVNGNPGKFGKPSEAASGPDPSLIAALSQVTIIHLLDHFGTWLDAHREQTSGPLWLPPHHTSWILALLCALSDVLTAEDVSILRRLARSCRMAAAGEPSLAAAGEAQRAFAWCVSAAVADVWGQHDLW